LKVCLLQFFLRFGHDTAITNPEKKGIIGGRLFFIGKECIRLRCLFLLFIIAGIC